MIYLDNAATTHKKPDSVYLAVYRELINSANPGRSGHKLSIMASEHLYQTREALSRLFKTENIENFILTPNATFSLNLAISSAAEKNSDIITTSMEHNSVMRPLMQLEGCNIKVVEGNSFGEISPLDIEKQITEKTSLIVINHASNVNGTIQKAKEISKIAKAHNVPLLMDASQTAGIVDIRAEDFDMIAFPGHKALYGPQGTGGLYIAKGMKLRDFLTGGTGSNSKELKNPDFLPDKFESGTMNTPGFCGLKAGVKFILDEGISAIKQYEDFLTARLTDALLNIKNVVLYSLSDTSKTSSCVAFGIKETDSDTVSNILDDRFNIAVRGGYHCAYGAHKTIGSEKSGVVRASVSYFNTKKDIDKLINAVNKIANGV